MIEYISELYPLYKVVLETENGQPIILKQGKDKPLTISQTRNDFYRQVTIDGKKLYIHRLVFEMVNNRKIKEGYVINHRDSDPRNNNPSNLEEVTASANNSYIDKKAQKIKCTKICLDGKEEVTEYKNKNLVVGNTNISCSLITAYCKRDNRTIDEARILMQSGVKITQFTRNYCSLNLFSNIHTTHSYSYILSEMVSIITVSNCISTKMFISKSINLTPKLHINK